MEDKCSFEDTRGYTSTSEVDLTVTRDLMQGVQRGMAEDATEYDLQERDRALTQIYERHYERIQRFILNKVQDFRLAEDLANDTFVRAFKNANKFKFMERDLNAWLVTIARNLVLDHFKSANTKRVVASIDDDEDLRQWADTARHGQPEEVAMLTADREELVNAIRDLKEDQRMVLALRYFSELSVAETAARMNKDESIIKALTFRALANLRKTLRQRAERADALDMQHRIA